MIACHAELQKLVCRSLEGLMQKNRTSVRFAAIIRDLDKSGWLRYDLLAPGSCLVWLVIRQLTSIQSGHY